MNFKIIEYKRIMNIIISKMEYGKIITIPQIIILLPLKSISRARPW